MSFLSFLSTENKLIPTEVRKEALQLQKLLEYDDEGGEGKGNGGVAMFSIFPLDFCFILWVS